jgi:FdhD protein
MSPRRIAAVRTLRAEQWRVGGAAQPIERVTAEEVAIGVCYDSAPYAVLMATPADVEELAIGFTVSEGIAAAADIVEVRVGEHPDGLVADVLLSARGAKAAKTARRRNLEGRSSCGLCGVQSLKDAIRPLPTLPDGLAVSRAAIQAALAELETRQVLGAATRAVHAAAWADGAGALLLVREDVGRHNALDKLIGAAHRAGLNAGAAFVVVTSRCSYEMVEKTAVAGVAMLVAISAPTALAIRKAVACNLTLVALARADGHTVFTGGRRIS